MPAAAISIPATQMNRARPTLPLRATMLEGVEKIPVPIMRLKMLQGRSEGLLGTTRMGGLAAYRKMALVRPMVLLESLV